MTEHGWGRSFSSAGLAFVISRGLLLLLAAGVGSLHREARTGMPDVPHAVLSVQGLTHQLGVLSRANDADWYVGIATHGYERRPFDTSIQANRAYFPLHPMLWRIGLGATGDGTLSGLLIANLLFLLGLAVVHRLAIASGRDAPAASRTVYALAFFPVSYFFSLPWSESLFLLLTAAAFLLLGIAAPASSGTMMSMPRYAMGLFPLALALADWTEKPAVACAWSARRGPSWR